MEHQEVLFHAANIARDARTSAERADLEATVEEFEHSEIRSLRSLARVYRMLQWPPRS
ncbi:MAG: hypothetical protein WBD74_10945 [Candidatus Aquilonibacter sp.]